MTEKTIPVIDIVPRGNASPSTQPGVKNSLGWSRSDNSFKFNFNTHDECFTHAEEAVSLQESAQRVQNTGSNTGIEQSSGFAFNFKIPERTEEVKTDTEAPSPTSEVSASDCIKPTEDKPQQNEPNSSSKAKKKKKKSGPKKKAPESTEQQEDERICSPPGSEALLGTLLSAEQQLVRELDWCIEQLELGLSTQKYTAKQKEEACRNLKTLRSSKAPLVKKRQVMRAVSGDYRKKMEEERDKQFKLIQAAMTSAKVKTVPKGVKAVFHRKADRKTETMSKAEKDPQKNPGVENPGVENPGVENPGVENPGVENPGVENPGVENPGVENKEETSSFVFTPAKEEFCFNFL